MPEYTAEIKDGDVQVARGEDNRFSIVIKPPASGLKNVIMRVSIPCGPNKNGENTFLLKDEAAGANVTYRLPDNSGTPVPIYRLPDGAMPEPARYYLAWETPSRGINVDAGTTMRVDVTGFGGNIPPGTAKAIVGIRQRGNSAENKFEEKVLDVTVTVKPGDEEGVRIHYFDASPDYILHAGGEQVVLSWHTSSAAKLVTLFKNNVKIWPASDGSQDLFFQDKPSITSVYRLEARENDSQESAEHRAVQQLTVQVAQAGWNRQPLHHGYPTVLMKAPSFDSGESERLYGIFVDLKTQAAGLYSSATGFPPWRKESGGKDLQDIVAVSGKKTYSLSAMSHSPGVACGERLWLIGGHQVPLNEVWYYHKNDNSNEWEWVRDDPAPFSARTGHCVVDFKNQLWVLGGFDGMSALNDAWRYDYMAKNAKWTPASARSSQSWPARCLFAAVATPAIGVKPFQQEKMWVYGGTPHPFAITPIADLWSTTDGANWTEEKTFELGPRVGKPSGATLFWDDGLHLAGSFKANTREKADDTAGATLSAMVYSLCAERFLWEANQVSWGWEQFGGNPFLMRSIVFNRFWLFWSLYREMKVTPKLNVFIPS